MELIGRIARLQVQRSNLKQGERPRRWFDPAPLQAVAALALGGTGVVGVTDDQQHIVDVHNMEHPQSKWSGRNGLSIGFTSHYERMRARFGNSIPMGIAGENVIVDTARDFRAGDLPSALVIATAEGLVRLEAVSPIEPCVEFSRYALGRRGVPEYGLTTPDPVVTETLAFLRHGTRGYLLSYLDGPTTVCLGDALYAV